MTTYLVIGNLFNWVTVSDRRTSAVSVEFCLCSTYVELCMYVVAGLGDHLYCVLLLPPPPPPPPPVRLLSCPIPSPWVCPTVRLPTYREGKDGRWDLGWKSRHIALPRHCYPSLMLIPQCFTFIWLCRLGVHLSAVMSLLLCVFKHLHLAYIEAAVMWPLSTCTLQRQVLLIVTDLTEKLCSHFSC